MSDEYPYRDREWLREQYHDQKLTPEEIGEKADVTGAAVRRWMDK